MTKTLFQGFGCFEEVDVVVCLGVFRLCFLDFGFFFFSYES